MSRRSSGIFAVKELVAKGSSRSPGSSPESSSGGADERRVDPRVIIDAKVTAIFRGGQRHYRLLDVSRSGALFERSDDVEPPATHTLVIDVGDGNPLRLLAQTVWTGPRHHAVVFLAQDDVDRIELAESIDRLVERLTA